MPVQPALADRAERVRTPAATQGLVPEDRGWRLELADSPFPVKEGAPQQPAPQEAAAELSAGAMEADPAVTLGERERGPPLELAVRPSAAAARGAPDSLAAVAQLVTARGATPAGSVAQAVLGGLAEPPRRLRRSTL